MTCRTVEAQLTTTKRPNPRILVRAAKSLLRFSPALTAAALTLFDQPLVGAILASAGEVAINFHEAIARHRPRQEDLRLALIRGGCRAAALAARWRRGTGAARRPMYCTNPEMTE